jgi:hypothetical protein
MDYCSILAPHEPIQPNDAILQRSREFTSKRSRFYVGAYPRNPDIEISKNTPRSRARSQLQRTVFCPCSKNTNSESTGEQEARIPLLG